MDTHEDRVRELREFHGARAIRTTTIRNAQDVINASRTMDDLHIFVGLDPSFLLNANSVELIGDRIRDIRLSYEATRMLTPIQMEMIASMSKLKRLTICGDADLGPVFRSRKACNIIELWCPYSNTATLRALIDVPNRVVAYGELAGGVYRPELAEYIRTNKLHELCLAETISEGVYAAMGTASKLRTLDVYRVLVRVDWHRVPLKLTGLRLSDEIVGDAFIKYFNASNVTEVSRDTVAYIPHDFLAVMGHKLRALKIWSVVQPDMLVLLLRDCMISDLTTHVSWQNVQTLCEAMTRPGNTLRKVHVLTHDEDLGEAGRDMLKTSFSHQNFAVREFKCFGIHDEDLMVDELDRWM